MAGFLVAHGYSRRYAHGPDGLIDGKAPGKPPSTMPSAELAQIIDSGPIPAVHDVVRWRLADLAQWVWDEFGIRIAKQTLSRELRAMLRQALRQTAPSRPKRARRTGL